MRCKTKKRNFKWQCDGRNYALPDLDCKTFWLLVSLNNSFSLLRGWLWIWWPPAVHLCVMVVFLDGKIKWLLICKRRKNANKDTRAGQDEAAHSNSGKPNQAKAKCPRQGLDVATWWISDQSINPSINLYLISEGSLRAKLICNDAESRYKINKQHELKNRKIKYYRN